MGLKRGTELCLVAGRSSRVAGRGVSPAAIGDAVARVVEVLGTPAAQHALTTEARSPTTRTDPSLLAAVSARSTPDLASRLRGALEQAGVAVDRIGLGAAGQHTVVTLYLPPSARATLETLAARARYSVVWLGASELTAVAPGTA